MDSSRFRGAYQAPTPSFLISSNHAAAIVDRLRNAVVTGWDEVCDQSRLTSAEKADLWAREFMNPYLDYEVP